MGFFVLFYLLLGAGNILGEREVIPALLAAWMPNLVISDSEVIFL